MSKTIIQVQNLSKLYKLGGIGTGTLSHDLNRWWHKTTGKEDPFLKEAVQNDRTAKSSSNYIWSLKDINFEIKEGEIFGVIGKNGAGKSTLLKLLSKISKPTTGTIKLNGRVASLLEVGTGFHPDLTGRENVFLNGAILGMKKEEISRKFDEIVDFSGVERFIDTPVKRYSSGMYVRLAFAVAAHLEPEILIIDEVLAVGDAEFQKKCLGKIKDISFNQGRTILFVSHNVTAIKQLSSKVLLLENGLQKYAGNVDEAIKLYVEKEVDTREDGIRGNVPVHLPGYFTSWQLQTKVTTDYNTCYSRDNCTFIFSFVAKEFLGNCELRFIIATAENLLVNSSSLDNKGAMFSINPGVYNLKLAIQLPIKHGSYYIQVALVSNGTNIDVWDSGTILNVLNNFETHVEGALLNLDTVFEIEEMAADDITVNASACLNS